jgi:hypothetical protein
VSSPALLPIARFVKQLVSSQPSTPLAGPPALIYSVFLASSAKTRWCVEEMRISVIFPVSMDMPRRAPDVYAMQVLQRRDGGRLPQSQKEDVKVS